jgi:DNA-binding NtrC family response regulator
MGIFNKAYKLPFEEQEKMNKFTMDSMKKMHSLFFPINWREAATGVERILLLSQANFDKDLLKSRFY